jgi:quinohemoprotein amine dehydrogenase
MRNPARFIAAFLVLGAGPAMAKPSLFPPSSVVRTTCIACHATDKDGAVTRIESVRTTPEEWENTIRRMERRHGLQLDAPTRKQALKELSATLGLTQDEAARVSYLLRSPSASLKEELSRDEQLGRTCASCHSWGKVVSHRRTPESWASLRDFHLASFPASTIYSYEDMKWHVEAKEALEKLTKWLPLESPQWKAQQKAKAPDVSGTWLAAGHQVGKGSYQATVTLKHRGSQDYEITKALLWDDGKRETWKGAGAMYGTHSLRARYDWPKSFVKDAWELRPDGHFDGTWTVRHYEHVFGDEMLFSTKGVSKVVRVVPGWLTPGGTHQVQVLATGKLGAVGFGPGTSVTASRPLRDGWTVVTVKVDKGAKPGRRAVTVGGKSGVVDIAIAPRVDYIMVTPQHGMARIGVDWDPAKPKEVPKQGVPFEAWGWSFGADGVQGTPDDVALDRLKGVDWAMREYFTTPEDRDVEYVGTLDATGMFMPRGFSPPYPDSPSRNNTGNVWVVARWRPGPAADPLQSRAYLWVTFPDINKETR